jgi:hypothetical protein
MASGKVMKCDKCGLEWSTSIEPGEHYHGGCTATIIAQRDALIAEHEQSVELRTEFAEDIARITAERDDAQHWRERHCRESEAASKTSAANWDRAKKAEQDRDALIVLMTELEWSAYDPTGIHPVCPKCHAYEDTCRHKKDCAMAIACGWVMEE